VSANRLDETDPTTPTFRRRTPSIRGRLTLALNSRATNPPATARDMEDEVSLPEFEVSMRDHGDGVVSLSGELDMDAAPALEACLLRASEMNGDELVVDLADVTFIDSTALCVLIKTRQRLGADKRRLRLNGTSPPVRRIFELAGLDELFDHHDEQPSFGAV
jgi:anti-sigma B factor antagonist